MSRFNLVYEPWIRVIYSSTGEVKLISLKTLFNESEKIESLAGDSRVQNFAVFRILLAILHTVYSRFNYKGECYRYLEVDSNFIPISLVDEDDYNEYKKELSLTWDKLWDKGCFSEIVIKYLEKNYDKFYLFDDKYPFFQVVEDDISEDKISKKIASEIKGKSFNRKLSESNNKVSLFSPRYEGSLIGEIDNKEKLEEDEIARWLIAYQGYTGLADKVIFGKNKYKASKGWLFDIGGIYVEGKNLFETLILNFVIVHPENRYTYNIQKPCWEYSSDELINNYMNGFLCDNLAQLYTVWSRAIYIDPLINTNGAFSCKIVKLPELEHKDQFLEPMTVWQYNDQGENKNTFTPRKHRYNQSMWRSFGLISSSINNSQRTPGIISWIDEKKECIDKTPKGKEICIVAAGMIDDNNATSWLPIDEIYDFLMINDYVLTDVTESKWIPRIENVVELTKVVVSKTFGKFLSDIAEVRNIKEGAKQGFINSEIEELYFLIDDPFREWLRSIQVDDSKDEKIKEWNKKLCNVAINKAKNILYNASTRDLLGIKKDDRIFNVVTAFNSFTYYLNQELKI